MAELAVGSLPQPELLDRASALAARVGFAAADAAPAVLRWLVGILCKQLRGASPPQQRGAAAAVGRLAFVGALLAPSDPLAPATAGRGSSPGTPGRGSPAGPATSAAPLLVDTVVRALRAALQSSALPAVRLSCLHALSNAGKALPPGQLAPHARGVAHMCGHLISSAAHGILVSQGRDRPGNSGLPAAVSAAPAEGLGGHRAAWAHATTAGGLVTPRGTGPAVRPRSRGRPAPPVQDPDPAETQAACECLEVWLRLVSPDTAASLAPGLAVALEFVLSQQRALLAALRLLSRHAALTRVKMAALYCARAVERAVEAAPGASEPRSPAREEAAPGREGAEHRDRSGSQGSAEERASLRLATLSVASESGSLGLPADGGTVGRSESRAPGRLQVPPLPNRSRASVASASHSVSSARSSRSGRSSAAGPRDGGRGSLAARSVQAADTGEGSGDVPPASAVEAASEAADRDLGGEERGSRHGAPAPHGPGQAPAMDAAVLADGAACLRWAAEEAEPGVASHPGVGWAVRLACEVAEGRDAWVLSWDERARWVSVLAGSLRWCAVHMKQGDGAAAADAAVVVKHVLSLLACAPRGGHLRPRSARSGAGPTGLRTPRLGSSAPPGLAPSVTARLRQALAELASIPAEALTRAADGAASAVATGKDALSRATSARHAVAALSSQASHCLHMLSTA